MHTKSRAGLGLHNSNKRRWTITRPLQSRGEIKRREMRWTRTKKLLSFAGPGETKRREVVLDPQVSPEEIKRREVVLDPQVSPEEIKRREVVLDPQVSPEEIKRREVELGSESWASFASVLTRQQCYGHCPCDRSAQQLKQQLRSTLVATQWRGDTALTFWLFWRWSTASSVFRVGARGRTVTLSPPPPPTPLRPCP